jgi:hypothetical protein
MKRLACRLPFTLALGWSLGLATATAHAQTPATSPAAPAPAYQDRVIESLQPLIDDSDIAAEASYDREGWARQWRVESRLGQDSFTNASPRSTGGVALYGLIETPNYGVLSIDSQLAPNPSGGFLTLRQRGLPLEGGWSVNNDLGMVSSLAPTLTRLSSRVYVPGYLLEGVATEGINPGQGLQLQASSGRPGRLDGTVIGRLQRLPGTVTSVGAQVDQAPWSLSARVAQASNVALSDDPTLSGGSFDARSVQLSARYATAGQSLQANMVATSSSALAKPRSGLWVDGETREGARLSSAGLFWLEPGLSWAGQPMASDIAGGYVRSAWQSRQWSAEGGIDLLRSVSNPSSTGAFITASGRWRYSRSVSFGAGASVRSFSGDAWNTFGDVRWQNDWGSTGLRFDLTTELEQSRKGQLTLDQDWLLTTGWSLATSVTAGRLTTRTEQQTLLAAAASVNAPLSSNVSLRGNLIVEQTGADNSHTGVNTGLTWRLTPRWSLEGNFNLTRGRAPLSPSIDPLATPLPFTSTITDSRSLFVVLRWEAGAGSRNAPLGGGPQEGGARIQGTVYFDANRNGRQEANEVGVPGITVFLDNRYSVRTDGQGHFEFPFVASGMRVITVQNETLPLPWVAAGDGWRKLEVRIREDLRIQLGVVRQGGD